MCVSAQTGKNGIIYIFSQVNERKVIGAIHSGRGNLFALPMSMPNVPGESGEGEWGGSPVN
jgi:hypothetical protein